jgi:hypothetical protein
MVEQIGLVAQLAAQPRVPLTPRFKAPGNRVEEPGFARDGSRDGRLAEETPSPTCNYGCQTPAHLILKNPANKSTWCLLPIIWLSKAGWSRHKWSKTSLRFAGAGHSTPACGYLSVVRQHTGVIKSSVDRRRARKRPEGP